MSAPCPVLGFVIRVTLTPSASDADADAIVDDLMAFLENHGLVGAGEGARTLEFVVHREGSQADERDRDTVRDWSARWARSATIDVGPLADLNPAA
jgi:uncharacterized protein YggL (DUF469 family)